MERRDLSLASYDAVVADIETLLTHFLPSRDIGVEEVIRQMQVRHRKRQAAIDFAYEKQQLE